MGRTRPQWPKLKVVQWLRFASGIHILLTAARTTEIIPSRSPVFAQNFAGRYLKYLGVFIKKQGLGEKQVELVPRVQISIDEKGRKIKTHVLDQVKW